MMLDLLDQCWQSKSSDESQAQLINMYLEVYPVNEGNAENKTKGKYKVVALPMRGLTLFSATAQGNVRDIYELNGVLYAVAGNQFYSVASNGTLTTIGTLNTSSGWCKIRAITGGNDSNHQIFIADGTYGYTYNLGSSIFQVLTQTTFVSQVIILTSGTGYTTATGTIHDATGTGATVTCNLNAGGIASVTVNTGGSNFTAPTVTFAGDGTGATGYVTTLSSNYPLGVGDIENQDDYILATLSNSMQFQICNPSDTTLWNPLFFASKFSQPDNIVSILSHEGSIWLMGDKSSEIWQDTGAVNFPFTRTPTFLHYGCAARSSVAVNGNYFIFLSSNRGGGYSIYQTLPRIYYYNPAPISNPPIDYLMSQMSTVADAQGFISNLDGHELYHLTFPTANQTFVYDIPKAQQADAQKGMWTYRQSFVSGSYGRFLANCNAFCYGKHLVGDYQSGNIYYLDNASYTENGTPILRELVTPPGPTYGGGKLVFVHRLQIDVETGIGANNTFTLEKSMDNGSTWVLVDTYTVPQKGGRIYANRLGATRYGMIFRVKTTMNAKFCILGFQADIQMGHS